MGFQCARFSGEPDVVRAAANNPPLRQGAKGDGVRALQLALIDLGFAMPISTRNGKPLPDGAFGAETQSAVIAFQRANGLVQDGVAGAHTLAELDAIMAVRSAATARVDALGGNKARVL